MCRVVARICLKDGLACRIAGSRPAFRIRTELHDNPFDRIAALLIQNINDI